MPVSSVTASSEVRYNQVRRGKETMEVNDKAPDFSTTDENGKEVALKDFRGKDGSAVFLSQGRYSG